MKTQKLFHRILTIVILSAALLPGPALAGALAKGPAVPVEPVPDPHHSPNSAAAPAPDHAHVSAALRSTPLMFVENVGQFDERARFQVRSGNATLYLADDALWFTVLERPPGDASPLQTSATPERFDGPREDKPRQGVNLKLSFVGANPHPRLEPLNRLDTRVSHFVGNDPAKWHADVPAWGGVRYVDLYPGVDLEITGEDGRWAWQLAIRHSPFAISNVRLCVEGADALALDGDFLRLSTAFGEFSLPLLGAVAADGSPLPTSGEGPGVRANTITYPFFSSSAPLLSVSPQGASDLLYSTFLGGWTSDTGSAIAVDGAGSAYVTGGTGSSDFPTTVGAFDTSHNGSYDAFVVKVNASGTGLAYATFLGGSDVDSGYGIAVDGAGSAYVTGETRSSDFPTTAGAFDTSLNSSSDAFVVKVNASGTGLAYATFLGGSRGNKGHGIAVDGMGSAYVTGYTISPDFPTTAGAFDTSYDGLYDAFVVKLNASGTGLAYATFLGGSGYDPGHAIAVDGAGSAYVTGETCSSDFPTTAGAFDTSYNGGCDAFVVKLNASGTGLAYATFLGGSDSDYGYAIAVDRAGSAYVTGETESSDFPTTAGAFDTSHNGSDDTFVAKVNATGTGLAYATFLGGSEWDGGWDIAVDGVGSAYVTGDTWSSDFPTTAGAFDTSYNGGNDDAFVVKVNASGTGLAYATFLGGSDEDSGGSIAVDGAGSAYVTGATDSSDFPTTAGAFDTSYNGGYDDAFVIKLTFLAVGTVTSSGGSLTSSADRTTYTFAAGTFTDTVIITHVPLLFSNVPPAGNLTDIGRAFEVTAVYSSTGQPAQPTQPYTVTVQYTEAEKGPAIEDTLALYYWDGSQWAKEPSSEVDTVNNTVTATPNHFSSWAVLGETLRTFLPIILKSY